MQKEWKCESIFVSSLYTPTIDLFKKEFESVKYIKRRRVNSYQNDAVDDLTSCHGNSFYDKYTKAEGLNILLWRERTETYLKELYFLSKCSCFISGKSSGGFIVPLLRHDEFDHIMYLDNLNKH